MGDDSKQPVKPQPKRVSVIVRASAHVDEAITAHGFVSKSVPLQVSESDAKRLLEAHSYLTKMGA